jgi:hypothetical protein
VPGFLPPAKYYGRSGLLRLFPNRSLGCTPSSSGLQPHDAGCRGFHMAMPWRSHRFPLWNTPRIRKRAMGATSRPYVRGRFAGSSSAIKHRALYRSWSMLSQSLCSDPGVESSLQPSRRSLTTIVTPGGLQTNRSSGDLAGGKPMGGGGGGGAHEVVEASKGHQPKVLRRSDHASQIIRIDRPKLGIEPTELTKIPDNNNLAQSRREPSRRRSRWPRREGAAAQDSAKAAWRRHWLGPRRRSGPRQRWRLRWRPDERGRRRKRTAGHPFR